MHRRRGVDPPMKVRRGTVTPSHHVDNVHLESPRGNGETDGDFCGPMSWEAMSLGEFIILKRGYDLPSNMRVHGHVPVVSSSGITGYHNVAKVEGPGVITGRYGTLGEVFFVADSFWPLNTSLYVQDFKGNDPKFSAYFLKTVLAKRSSDKAAVPGVNRNDLHRLSVRVTRDTGKQRTIASILSTYDDLIENNHRRIRSLEQTARLLYKEWFVHLRFPGHECVTINNGVPEGWERVHLSKLVTTQYGFTESATEEPVGPKFLRGMDINKTSYIDWSTVPFCPESNLDFDKYALNVDDIVVIRMADPGRVAIVETEHRAVFASYLVRLSRKTDVSIPTLYLFYVLSDEATRASYLEQVVARHERVLVRSYWSTSTSRYLHRGLSHLLWIK